jgi:hypothetical protein
MLAELHPTMTYGEICQLLIRAEHTGGTVLSAQPDDITPPMTPARAVSR